MKQYKHHTLSVLVENKAGVLSRIAGLFARRGFNIYSLAVAPTDDQKFSQITIVVDVQSAPLEQITKQLFKLINVVKISELDPATSCEYELILAKINAPGNNRASIIELVQLFGGKIVDIGISQLTVMLADSPTKVDDFEALLEPYGIIEVQRTGRVALAKQETSSAKLRSISGKVS